MHSSPNALGVLGSSSGHEKNPNGFLDGLLHFLPSRSFFNPILPPPTTHPLPHLPFHRFGKNLIGGNHRSHSRKPERKNPTTHSFTKGHSVDPPHPCGWSSPDLPSRGGSLT